MTNRELLQHRLLNQQIAGSVLRTPQELVQHFGAMQSQEYAQAKWAIGLRVPHLHEQDVEAAFNEGKILRTHVLRPTWHFVAPQDIRWILSVSAPRVQAFNAHMYRKTNLDTKLLNRCATIIESALSGGNFLTRNALNELLVKKKIVSDGVRLSLIMMYAELEAIICSGPRHGKQFTYALLEERVPSTKKLSQQEALAALALRYFSGRSPATIQDFAWWSGLTVKDCKTAAGLLPSSFKEKNIDGKTYIVAPAQEVEVKKDSAFLLPDYDEYGISYKDRSAIFTNDGAGEKRGGNTIFNHMLVIDGKIAGTWKRTGKNNELAEAKPFAALSKKQEAATSRAIRHYETFMQSCEKK